MNRDFLLPIFALGRSFTRSVKSSFRKGIRKGLVKLNRTFEVSKADLSDITSFVKRCKENRMQ